MRSHVLTDGGLTKHAGRFVWLSIDTEKPRNLAFVEKFPIESWPTLFVIDAAAEAVAFKWVGSATGPQLERLFDDGERAVLRAGGSDADTALVGADRLYGEQKPAEAAAAYRRALDAASPDWPKRSRAVESLINAHYGAKDPEGCARTAQTEAPSLPRGPSFANASVMGLGCALGTDPKTTPWRANAVAALEPLAREAVTLSGILADDRSGLYEALVEAREQAGDEAGARKLAGAWLAFLESEAAKAATAEARAAFDAHRVGAAMKLGDPTRAVPALQRTEKDLPEDYNAPARLALLYRELGRFDEALAATDRAMKKVYGPRKLRVLETRAGIYVKKGDRAAARLAFQDALAFAQSLPSAQRSERTVVRLKGEVEKLEAP